MPANKHLLETAIGIVTGRYPSLPPEAHRQIAEAAIWAAACNGASVSPNTLRAIGGALSSMAILTLVGAWNRGERPAQLPGVGTPPAAAAKELSGAEQRAAARKLAAEKSSGPSVNELEFAASPRTQKMLPGERRRAWRQQRDAVPVFVK